ncbi:hypothetical protein [Enterococcus sp. DIV0800]|uniref:hypothetical protein n=1 Tax=unclassified Enterococcus TaxID=2608891 RepID=UPI003D2FEFD3
MRTNLKEILNEAEETQPLLKLNGMPVYNFKDAQAMNKAILAEEKFLGHRPADVGERQLSPDGLTYARSKIDHAAINPETFFENRYRKVAIPVEEAAEGEKADVKIKYKVKYEVVIDYRAIKEQSSGNIYTNHIEVLVIGQSRMKGQLQVETIKTISPREFVEEFVGKLDQKAMLKITTAVNQYHKRAEGIQADAIAF